MNKTKKITALYERLSHDDEQIGDSNSIVNQKAMLESYAAQHGFENTVHYTDDGWSGANFERPSWKQLIADIEAGEVGCVIAKDMSRIGRDYLQTGFYTEVLFRQRGVRFIAISNGVDSDDQSSGEFAPFINIMSEWYVRDCSRKQKAQYQIRGKSGKPTTNTLPYGFKKDPEVKHHWLVDEEAAEVVRRIFRLSAEGKGPQTIAKILMPACAAGQGRCPYDPVIKAPAVLLEPRCCAAERRCYHQNEQNREAYFEIERGRE